MISQGKKISKEILPSNIASRCLNSKQLQGELEKATLVEHFHMPRLEDYRWMKQEKYQR